MTSLKKLKMVIEDAEAFQRESYSVLFEDSVRLSLFKNQIIGEEAELFREIILLLRKNPMWDKTIIWAGM